MSTFLALAMFASAVGAQAPVYPERGDCKDDRGTDRCSAQEQARVRELFGSRPIEEHAAKRDQVRRAFYVDGYGQDVVAIEFIRSKGSGPRVVVRLPKSERTPAPEALSAEVPVGRWNDVIDESRHFHRVLPNPPTAPRPKDEILLCMHSWVYTVESVEPRMGRQEAIVRRRTEDACDEGLTQAYANRLMKIALPLLPDCTALDPEQHRNEATMLRFCGGLSGDRVAAAQVSNRAYAFQFLDQASGEGSLENLAASDFGLDLQGAKLSGEAAKQRWQAFLKQGDTASFYYSTIRGVDATHVVVTGRLYRRVNDDEDDVANVEMLWENNGSFMIKSMSVSAYRRARDRQ